MVTMQKIFTNLLFSETLKGISNTLQDLRFVQLSVDEIVRGIQIPPPWYKVWVRNSLEKAGLNPIGPKGQGRLSGLLEYKPSILLAGPFPFHIFIIFLIWTLVVKLHDNEV